MGRETASLLRVYMNLRGEGDSLSFTCLYVPKKERKVFDSVCSRIRECLASKTKEGGGGGGEDRVIIYLYSHS